MSEHRKFIIERDQLIENLDGWCVIALKPGQNAFQGLIETPLTLEWNSNLVRVWTGSKLFDKTAQAQARDKQIWYAERCPDWDVRMYDLRSSQCPISIDWTKYVTGLLAGYNRGNAQFTIKE